MDNCILFLEQFPIAFHRETKYMSAGMGSPAQMETYSPGKEGGGSPLAWFNKLTGKTATFADDCNH